jgi:flagellar hook-associated protein 2
MGVRMNPGLSSAGIDPSTVEQLIQVQKAPIESAKKKKEGIETNKKEYEKFQGLLGGLDTTLSGLKTRLDFYKLKLESSHPDILDGSVSPGALLGNYEFEVRGLARTSKELAVGFPDKDSTPVGFGYMQIQRDDMEDPVEITIDPGMTLSKVAQAINDSKSGVKAMVINTKLTDEPFRLLVISEKSGREAKVNIDPDTTFLEFKEQVRGQNLDVLFEDVHVTDVQNRLTELIDGVALDVKKAEPGTKIEVKVNFDLDKTLEGIKGFVEKYNEVAKYINDQFQKQPDGRYGPLIGESALKSVMRGLQETLYGKPSSSGGKYSNLADIGITTEPKTGLLKLDETKVKQSLSDDYDSVAGLFIRSESSNGIADSLAQKLRSFRDPGSGAVKTRISGFEKQIQAQDKEIERQTRLADAKENQIRRQFGALSGTLSNLKSQGEFLKAKLGGGTGGSGAS